ncbi:MAG: histidine phosphatase family protein [Clostridiales bacterium]|nr:histidine phosphatase family protein [Clostridiales bacterium]
MTKVYFIRHAQSDNSVRDGRVRPLTEKGLNDCRLVTKYLSDKYIDIIFSSPFKRAVDTIKGFAEKMNTEIHIIEDFRERKSDSDMSSDNVDFISFMEQQWTDKNYTFSDGECLAEVQERNIAVLKELLVQCKGKNIVIGTHGTALSTIINYYDSTYGFVDFMDMVNIMPWVVIMSFNENNCVEIDKIDLFN